VTIDKVVDASAAAAILFDEPEQDAVVASLDGFALHAPFLLEHEIANTCVKKMRRDSGNATRYLRATEMLELLNIRLYRIHVRAVAELAAQRTLSAYDASYLWLARELGAELVTLDTKLRRALSTP
jgi:predicted nucleic acid-binding protein